MKAQGCRSGSYLLGVLGQVHCVMVAAALWFWGFGLWQWDQGIGSLWLVHTSWHWWIATWDRRCCFGLQAACLGLRGCPGKPGQARQVAVAGLCIWRLCCHSGRVGHVDLEGLVCHLRTTDHGLGHWVKASPHSIFLGRILWICQNSALLTPNSQVASTTQLSSWPWELPCPHRPYSPPLVPASTVKCPLTPTCTPIHTHTWDDPFTLRPSLMSCPTPCSSLSLYIKSWVSPPDILV